MLKIERFQTARELESLIQHAQENGLRIRLGSREWTVEIFDKTEGGLLDKFRSADSLATIFKSELASLHNKLGELRASEIGSDSGISIPNRDIRKVPRSNDPSHASKIDPDIEIHRTFVGVIPTIARISGTLGAPLVSHKLQQLGHLLNDEQIPLKDRTSYVLTALQREISTLRSISGDDDTPGHFQIENFCNYLELTSLERKKESISVLPQLGSHTAAALHHPDDPFALKRFVYKTFPVIARELAKDSKNKALTTKLQTVLGKFLKPDVTSLDFDKYRSQLMGLQKDVHGALKRSPLRDSADAIFESIAQTNPDRLETLLAEDLGMVAQALKHQGEDTLATRFSELAASVQSTSNINHLDLYRAVVELRFLSQQCLEKVDGFSQQASDTDEWNALRDKQTVRQFSYRLLSALEPWHVSPQEYEYVQSRVTQYEASKPHTQAPLESLNDKPWYELNPEEIFGKPREDVATTLPVQSTNHDYLDETVEGSSVQVTTSNHNPVAPNAPVERASLVAPLQEMNPTPDMMVKAYAKEIQNRIDQRKFLEKIEARDALIAQERHARALANGVSESDQKDSSLPALPEPATPTAPVTEQIQKATDDTAELLNLDTLESVLNQMRVDSQFYKSDAPEVARSIESALRASIERQSKQPLLAVEETEYRIALRSYQSDLNDFEYQGAKRKAIEQTIAKFNSQTDADFAEVAAKVAPGIPGDHFKQLLQQYAKDTRALASNLDRRIQQGYAHTEEQEIDQALLQSAMRKADFYAKALTAVEKTWPTENNADPKAIALETLEESRQLNQLLESTEPKHTSVLANIQDHLGRVVLRLFSIILSELQIRKNSETNSIALLSDNQLHEAISVHTALQHASSLSNTELQTELYAIKHAQHRDAEQDLGLFPDDLNRVLELRAAELTQALNAHLLVAKAIRASDDRDSDLSELSDPAENDGVTRLSSAERYWAQLTIDETITFLAKRLEAIRLPLNTR